MCFRIKLDEAGSKELMYDCLHLTSAALVRTDDQIMHIELIEHKLNLDNAGANREAPKRNNMDMTSNDYREFLEDFSFTVSEFKKWLNMVIFRGNRVKFPYKMEEFKTSVRFEDQKMHVMIGVEDKAYRFLEQTYWTDEGAVIDE